jgi:hypothetical protein
MMYKSFKATILALLSFCIFTHAFAQGTYAKIEASFNILNLATDPFDYTVTDVRVQILQPDNTTVSLPAFFDGGTTWRVRHTPTMTGTYTVTGVTLNGSSISPSNLQPTSWTIAGPPTDPGFIRVDPNNPHRFITANGQRFFPHGEDCAWDQTDGTVAHNVTNIFWKMGAAHENWSRVWMNNWDNKNLDWPPYGPTLPLGQLNLTVAQKWDTIVQAAEQAGIHFQMTLHHHGEYSSTVDPQWNDNPYNINNDIGSTNGFMTSAVQFFTNSTAISLTKRKLRYAVARWGYSPSIMAWELFNEVQFTDAGQDGDWSIIQQWHDLMAPFLRSQDNYQHLITTSSDLTEPIWDDCDYYTHHDYPTDVITGLVDAPDITSSQPVRPDFGSECGTNGIPQLGVDAPIWAGLMNGQSGDEEPWWWDDFDAENDYAYFRAVSDFVTVSGLGNQYPMTTTAPTMGGSALGPLLFSPSGGWADATQETFVVETTPPPGIANAPSYLQGQYHADMTPGGYTFDVNYTQSGTFSVQVLQIAASGAGLEIFLDGTLKTNIAFPSYGSDTDTNFTATIAVPTGSHSINIFNPGLDWILLGNITLNPYAPALSAYAVGNPNFSAAYVWNATNVYNTNGGTALAGTIQVAGLNPGSYTGTWWDTFVGTPISSVSFSIASTNNPATLNTPSILHSAALFVGSAPQASIVAPNLAQTLGTNSPWLSVPLTVNNNGGLPLGYSLSVTNTTQIGYTAINSTQPGGPAYAWKDYSAIGTDISSSFTALAPPKSAQDEGIAGPVNIGFNFPFYTNSYSQLYVSPNGFISFSPFSGDTSANTSLPNTLRPLNAIYFFWHDMVITNDSHVYTYIDTVNRTFTLQFLNMAFRTKSDAVNCELVLKSTGEIYTAYQSLAVSNNCTVGVQNYNGTQGTQVAFNSTYLQSGFAVLMTQTPWLRFDNTAGYVPGLSAGPVNLYFNPAGLPYGNYSATVLAQTLDPNHPLFTFPVSLSLAPIATWRQTYFGTAQNSGLAANNFSAAHDGIDNILAYAFGLNPLVSNPNPISSAHPGNYLELIYKRPEPPPADISYIPEVTSNLAGVWNSGPAWTSQTIVTNGDGTATVTVTDLSPINSTPASFIQIGVSPH